MTTNVVHSIGQTNSPTVMDYSSLAAWAAACPADLTAVDQCWIGEVYNQGEFNLSSQVSISATTSSTQRIILRAATGASFKDVPNTPLRYNASVGAAISANFNYVSPLLANGNFESYGLQWRQVSAAGSGIMQLSGPINIHETIFSMAPGNYSSSPMLRMGDAGSTASNCLFINEGINNIDLPGIGAFFGGTATNCTWINGGTGIAAYYAGFAATNCLFVNIAKVISTPIGTRTLTGANNATTDTSITTDSATISVTGTLTSLPAGSPTVTSLTGVTYGPGTGWDATPLAGSALINGGTSGAGIDIFGTTRPAGSATDIGCYEVPPTLTLSASGLASLEVIGGAATAVQRRSATAIASALVMRSAAMVGPIGAVLTSRSIEILSATGATSQFTLAQLPGNTRSTTATYFDNTGTLQIAAPFTSRINYNTANLSLFAPLTEQASTNYVRNPLSEGAVVGTPGTTTTNVAYSSAGGVTGKQIVATGTLNGIPYVDYRLFGTVTTAGQLYVNLTSDSGTQATASVGQTWTGSMWFQKVADSSTAPVTNYVIAITQVGTPTAYLTSSAIPSPSTWQRQSYTATLTNASTTSVQVSVWSGGATSTVGNTVDITIRVGGAQLEQTSAATSLIVPPVGARTISTRAADSYPAITSTTATATATAATTAQAVRSIGVLSATGVASQFNLAQLSSNIRSTTATYFDNTGTLQTAAPFVSRISYNPANLSLFAPLNEQASTNYIRNPRAEGAVVGTPGTIPTYWLATTSSGVSFSVVGVGNESGIPYIDVRFFGTPTTTNNQNRVTFELATSITASSGQTWSAFVYARLVAGTLTNTSLLLEIPAYNSVPAFLSNATQSIVPTSAGLATQQYSLTLATPATTATIGFDMPFGVTSGLAIDVTLRIGAPQAELKAVPTSIILPSVGSPAASVRAADSYPAILTVGSAAATTSATNTQAAASLEALSTLGATTSATKAQVLASLSGLSATGAASQFNLAQLSSNTRSTNATYFDSGGTLQTAAPFVSRISFDPTNLSLSAPLNEQASTNYIRNPRAQGAVVGSPGSAPTNWPNWGNQAGLTQTIVGTGVESGISYVDVRYNGTTTVGGFFPGLETPTGVAASNGQTWTLSLYARLVGGSLTNVNGILLGWQELNSSVSYLTSRASGAFLPSAAGLATQRLTYTATNTQATTAYLYATWGISFPTGVAVDLTLRFGFPQLELRSSATSVMLPAVGSLAVSVRAADSYPAILTAGSVATATSATNAQAVCSLDLSTLVTTTQFTSAQVAASLDLSTLATITQFTSAQVAASLDLSTLAATTSATNAQVLASQALSALGAATSATSASASVALEALSALATATKSTSAQVVRSLGALSALGAATSATSASAGVSLGTLSALVTTTQFTSAQVVGSLGTLSALATTTQFTSAQTVAALGLSAKASVHDGTVASATATLHSFATTATTAQTTFGSANAATTLTASAILLNRTPAMATAALLRVGGGGTAGQVVTSSARGSIPVAATASAEQRNGLQGLASFPAITAGAQTTLQASASLTASVEALQARGQTQQTAYATATAQLGAFSVLAAGTAPLGATGLGTILSWRPAISLTNPIAGTGTAGFMVLSAKGNIGSYRSGIHRLVFFDRDDRKVYWGTPSRAPQAVYWPRRVG